MQKSSIVRFIFITFVLTVVSACAVSGTFAQFITTDSGYDTIYIAEWGVAVAVDVGDTDLATEMMTYSSDDTSLGLSSNLNLSPGDSGYYTFGWTGTPQVDVIIDVNDNTASSMLSQGNQLPQTILNIENTAETTTEEDTTDYYYGYEYYSGLYGSWIGASGQSYEPIIWNLYKLDDDTSLDDLSSAENLIGQYSHEDITNVDNNTAENMSYINSDFSIEQTNIIDTYSSNSFSELCMTLSCMYFEYAAGTDITASYVVTWEWPLNADDTEASLNDTYLANLTMYDSNYNGGIAHYYIMENSYNDYFLDGTILSLAECEAMQEEVGNDAILIERPFVSVIMEISVSQFATYVVEEMM